MGSVYRIRKEQRQSGPRYIVDYRDNAGRRTMRRFKRARDAEAFKKQVAAALLHQSNTRRNHLLNIAFNLWDTIADDPVPAVD